jgi:hypothetical protein
MPTKEGDCEMCLTATQEKKLVEALTNLLESQEQADGDFSGEQREWHLPRLNRAVILLLELFPRQAGEALDRVKTPY